MNKEKIIKKALELLDEVQNNLEIAGLKDINERLDDIYYEINNYFYDEEN